MSLQFPASAVAGKVAGKVAGDGCDVQSHVIVFLSLSLCEGGGGRQ